MQYTHKKTEVSTLRRYTKDLTHMTSLRLAPNVREEAERAADFHGISFSAFVRQSIARNIYITRGIEDEVVRRTTRVSLGYNE